MSYIILGDVSKEYKDRVLFRNVTLTLDRGKKCCVIGPNGCGKSTLIEIAMGIEEPTSGVCTIDKRANIGFLPQEMEFDSGSTVIDEAMSEITYAYEYDKYREEGKIRSKVEKILVGLGFYESDFTRKIHELSGGWKRRIYLAKLLIKEPDVLILDEPTNHLDLDSLLWLENYLRSFKGAILMVAHDRRLIDGIGSTIYELFNKRLYKYTGTYEEYKEQKAVMLAQLEKQYEAQLDERSKLIEYIDKNRADKRRAGTVQARKKALEKLEDELLPPPKEDKKLHFNLPGADRTGKIPIELQSISKSYGERVVFDKINFKLERGERVALFGKNGCGKSTLLRILASEIDFVGERILGVNVRTYLYGQEFDKELDLEGTPYSEMQDYAIFKNQEAIRGYLGYFGLSGDNVFKSIKNLSGGEKARVLLAKIFLRPPNVLLMDEPTNHLDVATREILENALLRYEGTLCFVSHDRYFINKIATRLVEIHNGKLEDFLGGFDYYMEKKRTLPQYKEESTVVVVEPEGAKSKLEEKERKRQEAELRNALYKKKQEAVSQIQKIEELIHRGENRKKEIEKELTSPVVYSNSEQVRKLNIELRDVNSRLQDEYKIWDELTAKLAKIE